MDTCEAEETSNDGCGGILPEFAQGWTRVLRFINRRAASHYHSLSS